MAKEVEIKTFPHASYGDFNLQFQGKDAPQPEKDTALASANEARAVAEVQSAYVIAKKFPRNQHDAYQNIMDACKRPSLAEQAIYAYPRGGQMVKGPSIRLAEAIGQAWGNLDCGVREISQSNGVSVAEAYAIDLQTNTRITKVFHVQHKRDTKKGVTRLTDSRDIYELVANQGARRLRACILGIIPGDIIEAAVARCAATLESSDIPIAEQIKKMISAFGELGVKVEHLEKRLGHNLDATIPTEIVTLKGIYKSIKDGMAAREDFFEILSNKAEASKDELLALIDKNKKDSDKSPQKSELLSENNENSKLTISEAKVDKEPYIDPETGEVVPDFEEESVFGGNDKEVAKLTKDKK